MAIAAITGWAAARPLQPLQAGDVQFIGVVTSAVVHGPYGSWVFVETGEGPALLELPEEMTPARGTRLTILGRTSGEPGKARGVAYRGVVRAREVAVVAGPGGVLRAGEQIRQRVLSALEPMDAGRALIAGFLIGDTTGLDPVDIEAMRRAGLSHFTAVSGSNVALFLGLLFVAAGPLSLGPKRRSVIGLLGLPVYAAATGFEPSVMRASVMAGLVLVGRLLGKSLEAWQVMALAVAGLVMMQPSIGRSAGFQLSVAATAGVLVGARWPLSGGYVARALAVTAGAQLAVAPLLLLYFGRVPLLSPVANLVAAPIVTVATLAGSVGVAVFHPLVPAAAWSGDVVLALAHSVASWPQVGWMGVGFAAMTGMLFWRIKQWRGAMAVVAATLLVVAVLINPSSLSADSVAVLDVGQGDAILLSGGQGRYVLVDGGPDPVRLLDKIRAFGVRQIELVVVTHLHADHVDGLTALVGRVPIGEVWAHAERHPTPGSEKLFTLLAVHGVPVVAPVVGQSVEVGDLRITVLGPQRRYDSSNDESLVTLVEGRSRSILLSGDVEKFGQADLQGLHADVLKVPHHGGGTSDADWLTSIGADLAVISVGENDFGHPAAWVVEVLLETGAEVRRTDLDGDVIVPLD